MARGRKTGGRRKGTANKPTPLKGGGAHVYTIEALHVLAGIMRTGTNEAARIAAARELLDRGHGKAPQAHTDSEGGPLIPARVEHVHVTRMSPVVRMTWRGKQSAVLLRRAREVDVEGAIRAGKTTVCLWKEHEAARTYPGDFPSCWPVGPMKRCMA